MKISYAWLKKLVNFSYSPEELADYLTMQGIEIASIEKIGGDFDGIVIGKILDVKKHPEADKLSVCSVDVGTNILTIVCGASNVAQGQYVPVALEGSVLPGGQKITAATLKGVTSHGMICSASELNLSDDAKGIMVLEKINPGTPLSQIDGISDYVMEIELTPNRPDCLNMAGVAREISIRSGNPVKYPQPPEVKCTINSTDTIPIAIKNPDLCEQYSAYIIRNVKVAPSPFWLRNALEKIGLRSINNIVDVTNYALMCMGHPLHAFDLDKLNGPEIIVRTAKKNETIVTIDEKERILAEDMLVIADSVKPVALAGIMGGAETAVSDSTTNILLEGAYFNPVSIRKTSKTVGLSSDSSYRFERGTDRAGFVDVLTLAAHMIADLGKASGISTRIDTIAKKPQQVTISCNLDKITSYIGVNIPHNQVLDIFKKLQFSILEQNGKDVKLAIPSFRVDLAIQEDIVEELARIYGYNNIPMAFPGSEFIEFELNKNIQFARKTRSILTGMGFFDIITCSLTNKKVTEEFPSLFTSKQHPALCVKNPISEMQHALQTSLVPNMINVIATNARHAGQTLQFFEIGSIFIPKSPQEANEQTVLCIAVSGKAPKDSITTTRDSWDYFTFKGILEDYFLSLGLRDINYETASIPYLHPGRTACSKLNNEIIGYFGQIHPVAARQYTIDQNTFIGEFLVSPLLCNINALSRYTPLPKYPAVERDLAIVVDKSMTFQIIHDTLTSSLPGLLEKLSIISIYEGKQIPDGKKSINFRMRYRSVDRTLLDDEVDLIHNKLASVLVNQLNCEMR
ncbi:MAG: phenylalanine--tRNA ligase subunit beta [Candidatus Auribacter fodinae]|jgi:phenylalanyl-tRNA synthetase beta chain|uniref:Phenylalanine--tRNA ligase beta subunit n=1 Tax=Candidatus Auribacter fodinae TaxID=2093366 RepID=A0A3A4R6L6_9BACT|nr:MAG: phenylalanine--tRNA ligase subunit beta [Candidatus Auribacter fodinae]